MIIDFTSSETALANFRLFGKHNVNMVAGTTSFSLWQSIALKNYYLSPCPILTSHDLWTRMVFVSEELKVTESG